MTEVTRHHDKPVTMPFKNGRFLEEADVRPKRPKSLTSLVLCQALQLQRQKQQVMTTAAHNVIQKRKILEEADVQLKRPKSLTSLAFSELLCQALQLHRQKQQVIKTTVHNVIQKRKIWNGRS